MRRENKQSKCFPFHHSPAVLSFMSPSLPMPRRSPPPTIDFHITLYVFIYFIYFFLNIIDEPQEDRAMLILSLNLILLSDGCNGG